MFCLRIRRHKYILIAQESHRLTSSTILFFATRRSCSRSTHCGKNANSFFQSRTLTHQPLLCKVDDGRQVTSLTSYPKNVNFKRKNRHFSMITSPNKEPLNERERDILRHVVFNFIQSAIPVGSRYISKHFESQLSPATIRNVTRLPLPPALPLRDAPLPDRGAELARDRAGPPRGLPSERHALKRRGERHGQL